MRKLLDFFWNHALPGRACLFFLRCSVRVEFVILAMCLNGDVCVFHPLLMVGVIVLFSSSLNGDSQIFKFDNFASSSATCVTSSYRRRAVSSPRPTQSALELCRISMLRCRQTCLCLKLDTRDRVSRAVCVPLVMPSVSRGVTCLHCWDECVLDALFAFLGVKACWMTVLLLGYIRGQCRTTSDFSYFFCR